MINAHNKAIYAKLNGASGVTSLLHSATSIYFHQAPVGATMPYIVYIHAGGGDVPMSQTDTGDVSYYIKAVADTAEDAGNIANAIRTALHEQEAAFTVDAPWKFYRVQAQEFISFPENIEKTQIWHMGNKYRFRSSQ